MAETLTIAATVTEEQPDGSYAPSSALDGVVCTAQIRAAAGQPLLDTVLATISGSSVTLSETSAGIEALPDDIHIRLISTRASGTQVVGTTSARRLIPTAAPLVISNARAVNIEANRLSIEWNTSADGTPVIASGSTRYGVSGGPIDTDGPSQDIETHTYTFHRQRLDNLQPETSYDVEITSTHPEHGTATTTITVTTGEAADVPDPVDGYPVIADHDKPFGGLIVGPGSGRGVKVGDSDIANHVGFRFVVTTTTPITGFSKIMRRLNEYDMGSNAQRRALRDQGYTPEEAAWAIPRAYSKGNFTLYAELRRTKANGLPDMSAGGLIQAGDPNLASEAYDSVSNEWPAYRLPQPVVLAAGTVVCAILRNVDPIPEGPRHTLGSRADIQAYEAAHPNRGSTGINGVIRGSLNAIAGPSIGAYFGDDNLVTLLHGPASLGDNWIVDTRSLGHVPLVRVMYGDGLNRGYSLSNSRISGTHVRVNGSQQVRQVWTQQYDFPTDTLWVTYSHDRDFGPNGQSMDVTIRENGSVIASGQVPSSSALSRRNRELDGGGIWAEHDQICHPMSLGGTITLVAGRTYTVTFSAPSGANFAMRGMQDVTGPTKDSTGANAKGDYNRFVGWAERSDNGGSSWTHFSTDGSRPYQNISGYKVGADFARAGVVFPLPR